MYALHICFYFRTQRWQPSDNTKARFNTHEGSSLSFGCCASFFFSALPRRPNGPGTTRRLAPRPAPVRPSQPEKGQNTTRTEPPMGRILYVISSFDRGQRLGKKFANKLDKLDFVLMMLDEMREACEVSAWERMSGVWAGAEAWAGAHVLEPHRFSCSAETMHCGWVSVAGSVWAYTWEASLGILAWMGKRSKWWGKAVRSVCRSLLKEKFFGTAWQNGRAATPTCLALNCSFFVSCVWYKTPPTIQF